MAAARAAEYADLTAAAREALADAPEARGCTLRRLRSDWRAVGRRDFFLPPEREEAATALRALATVVGEPVR
ncbi:hypothetical protein [Blastococcus sp. SYSU D00695]